MTDQTKYPAWQSVETAPKNGTPILGFIADDPEFVVVFYNPYPGNKDWKEVSGEFYHRYDITHWMPLPPLPEEVLSELKETTDIMREILKAIPDAGEGTVGKLILQSEQDYVNVAQARAWRRRNKRPDAH